MSKTIKALLVIVGGLLLLACIGCFSLVQTHRANQKTRQIEFENAAQRLGFEPTFNGVVEYIKRSVETEMTRSEVEQILSDIAPLRVERGEIEDIKSGWGPTACDHIWLDLSSILTGGPVPIIACYDEMGRLVKMDFAEPDAPPLDIYAPLRE
jgi:hypothetical protein